MKHLILVCLMMLCLVLPCGVARAVDWNLYALPDQSDRMRAMFFPNRDEVYWSQPERCWVWIRGGEEVARLTEKTCPVDVRDCRYHNCYSVGIFRDGEDDVRIHLSDFRDDGVEDPDVLVPFEDLPPVANHSLRYVWGSPTDGDAEDWADK